MKNALLILAGGKGKRFGEKTPKQFYKLNNESIIDIFLSNLDTRPFELIVISVDKKFRGIVEKNFTYKSEKYKFLFSEPGKTRQESSFNALKAIKRKKINNVLIHDAARPFCSNNLIKKIIKKLDQKNNCIPYIEYSDRQIDKKNKTDNKVLNIQTPQGFNYDLIFKMHKKFNKKIFSDDASLFQESNLKVFFIKGEKSNVKITYPDDIIYFKFIQKPITKSGIGYDIHQLNKKTSKGLKLCGINIPFSKLIGHSDADVGLHAICDSIFGALSMRDIGYHFPNTNKKWKNKNSSYFVTYCKKKLLEKGFYINNLDINIIAEKPNITKYVSRMKKRVAQLLKINENKISIKATTNEKIGFIGDGEGIAAEAIVQISNENFN